MHLRYDRTYATRGRLRVAMVASSAVVGDVRVLRTAQTVRKLGYSLSLYGIGAARAARRLEGYPFEALLLPNPRFEMERLGRWSSRKDDIDYSLFCRLAADSLREHISGALPDVLHTHGMLGLAIGARLVDAPHGSSMRWIHDVHEHAAGLTDLPAAVRDFFVEVLEAHVRDPDAVTCASPALAASLSETYALCPGPTAVLNVPRRSDFDPFCTTELRGGLGLPPEVPLIAYTNSVKPVQGVDTTVDALPVVRAAHLAIVTDASEARVAWVRERAERAGVSGRVHFHPRGPFASVTSLLRTASVGVHPARRWPDGGVALPEGVFEFLHAGLPVVVSSTRGAEEFVATNDVGEVVKAGGSEPLAGALEKVIARLGEEPSWRDEIRARAERYSWEEQEVLIEGVYESLGAESGVRAASAPGSRASSPVRVVQLPVAAAGQARALADALRIHGTSARALVMADTYQYGADVVLDRAELKPSHVGGLLRDLIEQYDVFHYHRRPLLYARGYPYPTGLDLLLLRAAGRKVFFHFRGSEARLASVFEKGCEFNYVEENPNDVCGRFEEKRQRAFMSFARGVCSGVFVTDPELQTYVPWAQVVPRVVDLKKWACVGVQAEGALRVAHAPTVRGTKGSAYVLAAVERLQAEGVGLEFRLVENQPNDEAQAAYRWADVVVDQLRIGWYGVLAVEAMALGKAVVAYIRDDLKHHLPYPFPLAVANPKNIYGVLKHLAERRDEVRELGARGRRFVEDAHDAGRIAGLLLELYEEDSPIDPTRLADLIRLQSSLGAKAPGT